MKGLLRLKIEYDGDLNTELDKALRTVCKKFGYKWWASGRNMKTGMRDLAFDKEAKDGD